MATVEATSVVSGQPPLHVVTGASRGIGAAVVERLVARAAGRPVIIENMDGAVQGAVANMLVKVIPWAASSDR